MNTLPDPPDDSPMKALEEAIAACGSATAFAARIGQKQTTVAMWKKRGRVAAEACPAIERETGVRCERLRKDIPWEVLRAYCCGGDSEGS